MALVNHHARKTWRRGGPDATTPMKPCYGEGTPGHSMHTKTNRRPGTGGSGPTNPGMPGNGGSGSKRIMKNRTRPPHMGPGKGREKFTFPKKDKYGYY